MNTFVTSLFPLLVAVFFLFFFWVLRTSYKKSTNIVTLYIAMTLLFEGITFLLYALPATLLPSGSLLLTYLTNPVAYLISYIGIAYFSMTISPLLFPKIEAKYFFFLSLATGILLTWLNVITLQPTTINESAIVERHIHSQVLLLNNILITFAFIPTCATLFIRTLKAGIAIKGIIFTSGVALLAIFLPLSLQVTESTPFYFFNILSLLGCLLMGVALGIHIQKG